MFTEFEAETILREHWDDATCVGGFFNELDRIQTWEQILQECDLPLDGYELLGSCCWMSYEEYNDSYLLKSSDQSLWVLSNCHSVYSLDDYRFNLYSITIKEWLEQVEIVAMYD